VAEGGRRTSWGKIEGLPILIVLLVIVGIFMITAPQSFLGSRIYMSFLATVPPPLILGLGLTLVIAAGEIDLSFPSVVKMSGITFAMLSEFVAALCVRAGGRQLEPIERALAGQGKSLGRRGIGLARQDGHQGIVTQGLMVVEVFVAQGDAEHPLSEQFFQAVHRQ
jgi:ribose/xylose/arabinose/galactoside ABC-type transport system permease subunit